MLSEGKTGRNNLATEEKSVYNEAKPTKRSALHGDGI